MGVVVRNLAQGILERRRNPSGQRRCSFCGRSGSRVGTVIAGLGVYICDECIEFYNEILEEDQSQGRV